MSAEEPVARARFEAALLGATALALAAGALGCGALETLVVSPVLWLLASQARAAWQEAAPATPRLAGAGGLACTAGLLLLARGSLEAGLGAALGGGLLAGLAARRSLREEPVPPVSAAVSAGGPSLEASVAADLALRAAWELAGRRIARIADAYTGEARALAQRHAERGWLAEPQRAHPLPPPLEKPECSVQRRPGLGRVERIRFESEYEPPDPERSHAFLARARNRQAVVWRWRHGSSPRPTLVCVHGFGMGRVTLDAWRWNVRWLHQSLGLDVALVVLPLHGPRATAGLSGLGFFDVSPFWTAYALGQSVWDVRRVVGWLRGEGAPALGVYGISLGGLVAALVGSLDAGLAAVVGMTPAVRLEAALWRHLPEPRRSLLAAEGLDRATLEAAWAPYAPLRHRPRAPFEARLLVAGVADRIVPPADVRALWEHWGRPALHWFPGTHLIWRGGAERRAALERHLRATLLAEIPPGPPPLSRFRS